MILPIAETPKKTIICHIATLTRGGAEKVMVGLANHLAKHGYNVYLLTLEPQENLYLIDVRIRQVVMTDLGPVRWSMFPDDGIQYHPKKLVSDLRVEPTPSGVVRMKRAIDRVTNLRHFIEKTGAEAIISFMGKTNLRTIMAASGTGTKCFVSVRSAPEKEYPGRFRSMLARFLFEKADGIVFQSEGARSFFGKRAREKSVIILNPIDGAFFKHSPMPGQREEIITAGRLTAIKNHPLLIRAFEKFHKSEMGAQYSLILYGDGEEREALEVQVQNAGIQQAVEFRGDRKDLNLLMNGASLFVLSSDFEGMPNAIAEAFALKIPVVATDAPSGGIRALIGDNERGLLVPVGDDDAMAEAMERMLTDRVLRVRLVEAAYEFAQTLTPETIYAQWIEYIEKGDMG